MSTLYRLIIIFSVALGVALCTIIFIYVTNKYIPIKQEPSPEQITIIAENWIRNFSPSYSIYGKNLKLTKRNKTGDGKYDLVFTFDVDNPEFGNYERVMIISTESTEVLTAITNGIFDEKKNEYLTEIKYADIYFVIVEDDKNIFQPVQREYLVITGQEIERNKVLNDLFQGPNLDEKMKKYKTFIDEEATVLSFATEEGVAYIEIDCIDCNNLEIAKLQIEKTISQFDDIHEVQIEVQEKEDENIN